MKLLILLLGALNVHCIQAQEVAVSEWQHAHPEVVFIEQEVYNSFSEDQLNKLSENVIVYNTSIQAEDIEFYIEEKALSIKSNGFLDYSDPDADFIKEWLGRNKQIVIVRENDFNVLSEQKKSVLLANGALVLTSEFLTLEKISEYESNH